MKFKIWWADHAYEALMAMAIGALVALFLFNIAFAAGTSVTLKWTLATQYVNGNPLAATDIKETLVEWRVKGQTALAGSARIAAPTVTTIVDLGGASCGAFDFVAKTVLKDATTSDPSAVVPFDTGVKCKPNPPTAVTAT